MQENEFIELVKKIGIRNRLAGTKGESKTFQEIRDYISKNIGGKKILQKYKFLCWKESADPIFLIEGRKINCRSVYYNPKAKIKGTLEFFKKDDLESGNEMDVYCLRNKKGIVVGFVNVLKKFKEPFFYNKGMATYLLPSIIVGSEEEEFIKTCIGKEASLQIFSKFLIKESHNLIHKLSNRKNKYKLIIGAHVDTVPYSRGILDNATGVATILKISEKLKMRSYPLMFGLLISDRKKIQCSVLNFLLIL